MGDRFVFELGVALLAFVIAFYALTARERRTPLIVNSVYYAFYFVFGAMLLAVFARQLTSLLGESSHPVAEWFAAQGGRAYALAEFILVVGAVVIFDRIWRLHNQHKNFRTDSRLRNLAPVRQFRFWWRNSGKRSKTYTHHPVEFTGGLLQDIRTSEHLSADQLESAIKRAKVDPRSAHSMCAAFRVKSFAQADRIATDLAIRFLRHDGFVQYASCARHPIEFWARLQADWNASDPPKPWATVSKKLVIVDAFTPHFGFTDSIHREKRLRMEEDGAEVIQSDPSFAGLHTATMDAFKHTMKQEGGDSATRQPTLVIYEGVHALVELETIQQYRVFMRHVLPSERLWGGMFTLLIESSISMKDFSIVRSYADVFVGPDGDTGPPALGGDE